MDISLYSTIWNSGDIRAEIGYVSIDLDCPRLRQVYRLCTLHPCITVQLRKSRCGQF
jgi:hypothetical protein